MNRCTVMMMAAALVASSNALAVLPQRTFVSVSGNDANTASNCSVAAPCRSFGSALTVTASGGEIVVIDSGGYGSVTIDRSVTIVAPAGIYAGISVFSGTNGVDINTPGASVMLKGLTLNGQGGNAGVDFQQGTRLVVENCEIANLGGSSAGIYARAPGSTTTIKDSLIRDSGLMAVWAVQATAGQTTTLVIENTTIANGNNYGLYAGGTNHAGTALVYASNVSVVGSGTSGVVADTGAGGSVLLSIVGSSVSGNSWGLVSNGGSSAKLVASHNQIVHNLYEAMLNMGPGSVLSSATDNIVHDNNGGGAQTTGTIGTLTPL